MNSAQKNKPGISNAWGMTLVICLTIVISSAATATAAKLITGAQIKNGTITGADIKNGSISAVDLAPDAARAGAAGARGSDGAAGKDGLDGTARAYASVVTGDPPVLNPGKVKGFLGVTHPSGGAYCLKLAPGIDRDSVAPVATVDFWTSPAATSFVEVHSAGTDCQADEIEIITRGSDGQTFANDVGFHVIVP